MDNETGIIINPALKSGDHITVLDPATNEFIDDVIRLDPPVKMYFFLRLQRLGRLDNLQVK
ncbi:MAG: hypothetical protein MJ066_05600 [Clostridia bacterium]|nr:hypothetical protein [Clostridia bacterium]